MTPEVVTSTVRSQERSSAVTTSPTSEASVSCAVTPQVVTSFGPEMTTSASAAAAAVVTMPATEPPIPTKGLWDFEKEYDKKEKEFEDGNYSYQRRNAEINALTESSKRCYYYYRDEETFLAALELVNRQKYQACPNLPTTDWKIFSIDDKEKFPPLRSSDPFAKFQRCCTLCEREFVPERVTHFVLDGRMDDSLSRYCLGCIGRLCVERVGFDKTVIMDALQKLRVKQTGPSSPTTYDVHKLPLGLHDLAQRPHLRQDCTVQPFCALTAGFANRHCLNCKCYVCDVPATQCPEWATHCKAIQGETEWDYEYEKMHPEAIPEGFFDFQEEEDKARRRTADWKLLQERAMAYQYTFQDEEAFRFGLELYVRKSSRLKDFGWGDCGGKCWEPRYGCNLKLCLVRGRHKSPCDQCRKDFNGEKYYILDEGNGISYHAKVCVGCMGRNIVSKFGSQKATLLWQLKKMREEQTQKTIDGFFVPTFNCNIDYT